MSGVELKMFSTITNITPLIFISVGLVLCLSAGCGGRSLARSRSLAIGLICVAVLSQYLLSWDLGTNRDIAVAGAAKRNL